MRTIITNIIINEAVQSSIDDFINNVNKERPIKSWAETDAENGLTPQQGKEIRMMPRPNSISVANNIGTTCNYKFHTYQDWVENYKPKGISFQQYCQIAL